MPSSGALLKGSLSLETPFRRALKMVAHLRGLLGLWHCLLTLTPDLFFSTREICAHIQDCCWFCVSLRDVESIISLLSTNFATMSYCALDFMFFQESVTSLPLKFCARCFLCDHWVEKNSGYGSPCVPFSLWHLLMHRSMIWNLLVQSCPWDPFCQWWKQKNWERDEHKDLPWKTPMR